MLTTMLTVQSTGGQLTMLERIAQGMRGHLPPDAAEGKLEV